MQVCVQNQVLCMKFLCQKDVRVIDRYYLTAPSNKTASGHTPINNLQEREVLLYGSGIKAGDKFNFHVFINSSPLSGTGPQTVHYDTAGRFFAATQLFSTLNIHWKKYAAPMNIEVEAEAPVL